MPRLSYVFGLFCLRFLIVALIVLSITSCAAVPTAQSPVQCQHPLIDPSTDHGVYRALLSYQREIDQCNALNGFEVQDDNSN